jgi:hypothetical protein
MKMKQLVSALIMIIAAATSAQAISTQIIVHVKAKDAQFIGTSMGGVLITIKNAQTGELLAKGKTSGGTGSTDRIMTTLSHGVPMSNENAAKFTATLDIDEPVLVEVAAQGPLKPQQAANRVSVTQWVVPGKNITGGDAWLIEIPGFAVEVQAPTANIVLAGAPYAVKIKAHVTMMCGCPITPGGLWDANKIEVAALLIRNGKHIGVLPLSYDGNPSRFSGTWTVKEPGTYQATVYAYDASNGNTGLDSATFVVAP